jgi:hypothetical protein
MDALLGELCVDLGFCLPPDEHSRLMNEPPSDVDAFTDAVFVAEGMRPHGDLHLRRQVRERVLAHFKAAEEASAA